MAKLIICNKIYNCNLNKKLSSYDNNYYDIDWKSYGDGAYIHTDNTMIKIVYNEVYNTLTLIIGHYDYLNERFIPLLELSDSYAEKIDFGGIIWDDTIDMGEEYDD